MYRFVLKRQRLACTAECLTAKSKNESLMSLGLYVFKEKVVPYPRQRSITLNGQQCKRRTTVREPAPTVAGYLKWPAFMEFYGTINKPVS